MESNRRERLAQGLLGLVPGRPISEAEQRLTTATCAAILSDMVGHIQRAVKARGAGLPVVKPDGALEWFSLDEVIDQIDTSVRLGDSTMTTTFRDLLKLLEQMDPDNHIILGMASSTSLRIFRIGVDDQTGKLRELLKDWGG